MNYPIEHATASPDYDTVLYAEEAAAQCQVIEYIQRYGYETVLDWVSICAPSRMKPGADEPEYEEF